MEKLKQLAIRFLKWFKTWYVLQYRKRGCLGKIVVAFVSFSVLLCSCSSPAAILSPSTPTPIVLGITAASTVEPTKIASPSDTTTPTVIPTNIPTTIPTDIPTVIPTAIPTVQDTPTLVQVKLNPCLLDNAQVEQGKVVSITDGDTVRVVIDGVEYPVRYIGIDTPERERPLYEEAIKANSEFVLNKEVVLIKDISDTDSFDRLLRYVFVGDVFVNLEMVKLGLAVAEDYPPDSACASTLAETMNASRSSQIGLWEATQTPEASAPIVEIIDVNKEAEFVDIQNKGNSEINLSGWNLVSEKGNQECPLSGTLNVGETLRIWTKAALDAGYSCGYSTNIWNNSESDPAVLYNPEGVEVSRH